MITVQYNTVDVGNFNAAIANIIATSKRERPEKAITEQQVRLLSTDFMHYTPPFAGGAIDDNSSMSDYKAGVESVKRDILKTMTPPSILFKGGYKDKYLEKLVKQRDVQKLEAYFKNVKSSALNKYKVKAFDPQLHITKRGYGGGYKPKYQFVFTPDEKLLNQYIKDMSKRVGYLKAGWALTVVGFGGKVPNWVNDDAYFAKGGYVIEKDEPGNYVVRFWNNSSTISKYTSNYNIAIRKRTNAMARQYKDYMNQLLKQSFKQ